MVNVLANDYDPNNNINNASLAITGGPNNGSAYISNNMIVYLPNGAFAGMRQSLTRYVIILRRHLFVLQQEYSLQLTL